MLLKLSAIRVLKSSILLALDTIVILVLVIALNTSNSIVVEVLSIKLYSYNLNKYNSIN